MDKKSGDTKENILISAKELFIERGYDRTRMNDIASRAGVNKVMLYYHFQSKENILRELIRKIITSAKKQLTEAIVDIKKENKINAELILEKLNSVIGSERKFIRIILSEVLRGNLDNSIVLSLLRDFYMDIYEMLRSEGINEDRESFVTKMLFFQGLPLIMYYALSEDISLYYGIKAEKMKRAFGEKFSDTLLRTFHRV
jgi:AcrR family transcriptional regulator